MRVQASSGRIFYTQIPNCATRLNLFETVLYSHRVGIGRSCILVSSVVAFRMIVYLITYCHVHRKLDWHLPIRGVRVVGGVSGNRWKTECINQQFVSSCYTSRKQGLRKQKTNRRLLAFKSRCLRSIGRIWQENFVSSLGVRWKLLAYRNPRLERELKIKRTNMAGTRFAQGRRTPTSPHASLETG